MTDATLFRTKAMPKQAPAILKITEVSKCLWAKVVMAPPEHLHVGLRQTAWGLRTPMGAGLCGLRTTMRAGLCGLRSHHYLTCKQLEVVIKSSVIVELVKQSRNKSKLSKMKIHKIITRL